jgi:hypothetical protein
MSFAGDEVIIMATSIKKNSSSIWRRFYHFIRTQTATRVPVCTVRVVLFAVIVGGVMIYAPTRNAKPVRLAQAASDCAPAQTRINLVFIIDRSGSMANQVDAPPEKTSSNGR